MRMGMRELKRFYCRGLEQDELKIEDANKEKLQCLGDIEVEPPNSLVLVCEDCKAELLHHYVRSHFFLVSRKPPNLTIVPLFSSHLRQCANRATICNIKEDGKKMGLPRFCACHVGSNTQRRTPIIASKDRSRF